MLRLFISLTSLAQGTQPLSAMVNTLHDSERPTREEKSAELERILESQALHGAEILKSFLRFVVVRDFVVRLAWVQTATV